jgi:hypothetical protein
MRSSKAAVLRACQGIEVFPLLAVSRLSRGILGVGSDFISLPC